MSQLSATIITRNEEANIERCLQALQGVADEIIVVDSYSTDRTLDICQRYGCKITQREFNGFGSQRQYAAGLTSHTFVLSVDADEVLDDDLRQKIIALKEKGFDHRVYSVAIRNYFCGQPVQHSGYESTRQVRLFNKRYAGWNLRDVSDRLTFPDSVIPEPLPGYIHHYRCASLTEFFKKENRLAALQARVLAASSEGSINPCWPRIRAIGSFFHCLFSHSAWLDGTRGFAIARRKAETTYQAWRMARHLIREERK